MSDQTQDDTRDLPSWDAQVWRDFLDALGIGPDVKGFTLRVVAGELPRLEVERYDKNPDGTIRVDGQTGDVWFRTIDYMFLRAMAVSVARK